MFRFSRLSLKGHLLIARGSSAYYSWAVRLLLFARMLILRIYYNIATRRLKDLYLKHFQGGGRLVVGGGKLPFLPKIQQKVGCF